MRQFLIAAAVAAGAVMASAPLSAQQPDQDMSKSDQLAPSQMRQPRPAAVPVPDGAAPAGSARAAPRTVVACSGAFSQDSSMVKLAMAFDSRNVTFVETEVAGSKVASTIVYPKEPKRRLEVWWVNPANRSGTYLILINGQSTWTAPGDMRLGLTLDQMQKLNRKPFKLKGFDKDGTATISDWNGGALATIPGGCKSGVSFHADPKADADALSALPADHEFSSDDAAMHAVKPVVSEILIGY